MGKAEFAAFIGVSPARVSQYIADAKLSGEALPWISGFQRIRVAVAMAQLRERLDPSQMLGNGKNTRLVIGDGDIVTTRAAVAHLEAAIAARFDRARDDVLRILRTVLRPDDPSGGNSQ